MDDLKLSHLEQQELDNIINHLNDIFGCEGELLVASYGKAQEYLGDKFYMSSKMCILAQFKYSRTSRSIFINIIIKHNWSICE